MKIHQKTCLCFTIFLKGRYRFPPEMLHFLPKKYNICNFGVKPNLVMYLIEQSPQNCFQKILIVEKPSIKDFLYIVGLF